MSEESFVIPPANVPPEVRDAWQSKGWPEATLERAFELRARRADIDRWLTRGKSAIRRIQRDLDRRERMILGTMRLREATWDDDEALAELYANSPLDVDEWEVTVERGPYPFAQFRLQENVDIQVLEDKGVILAAIVHSARNTLVGGKRITVQIESSWRTRKDARGHGFGHLPRAAARRAVSWRPAATYYYRRSRRKQGARATIFCYLSRPFDGDAIGIRLVRPADLSRCVELINRTHCGLDLFLPYTEERFEMRLDDPYWGPSLDAGVHVFGWEDYYVLEEDGDVVACAGLWDRGRDVREVWRSKKVKGETHTIAPTALMDFGHAEGREDALARLIEFLIGETDRLGRDRLMAPLQFLPSVAVLLTDREPVKESRPLYWQAVGPAKQMGLKLDRPYTDLGYW